MSDDLRAFLLARIDEDATLALDTTAVQLGYSWRTISWLHGANRAHGERWAPERVLAECEAKRRIVELHKPLSVGRAAVLCEVCQTYPTDYGSEHEDWPCETLRLLALPYADHPDFDEAWRP